MHGRSQYTEAGKLCTSKNVFEIGQDGHFLASNYNIIHFQLGAPYHFSESDSVGIILRMGYHKRHHQSIEVLR